MRHARRRPGAVWWQTGPRASHPGGGGENSEQEKWGRRRGLSQTMNQQCYDTHCIRKEKIIGKKVFEQNVCVLCCWAWTPSAFSVTVGPSRVLECGGCVRHGDVTAIQI